MSVANKMVEERKIVAEGLELGLTLSQMKFACPIMENCKMEHQYSSEDKFKLRRTFCHHAINYKICEAYKK